MRARVVGPAGCSAGDPLGAWGVHKGARRSTWAGEGGYVPQKKCSWGSGQHLASPLPAPPRGFLGKEEKEARGPLRPAGPGCHLYRGRSHLRLWLAREAGTRGGDARPRAFGGRPERWLRGREDRDVAADAAAAAEDTRSPWVWSPRLRPSHPEDQEAGRGGGAASAATCGNALAPPRSASAGRGRYCSPGPEGCGGAASRGGGR